MRRHMRPRSVGRSIAFGLCVTAVLLWPGTVTTGSTALAAYRPLPAHTYAPYYETYLAPHTPALSVIARRSGARYFTLAFLQTPRKGSCALDWNGNPAQPLGYYTGDIAVLGAMGGGVIPSFGGYSADQGGTEIADSCHSVRTIAAAYESVIRTLDVTRLDMDVEARSLTNPAGINRRNQAIERVQDWAARHDIPLQVQYTLPVEPYGLDPSGLAVLHNAIANGTRVNSVNIMVFDYYLPHEGTLNMRAEAVSAAKHLHRQLASLYPGETPSLLWAMTGMTLLPGIDDHPARKEVTYLSDAQTMLNFAQIHGMNFLSIWAIQRDNGGCPGVRDSNTCSGIVQKTWAFSHLLEPFTR